MKKKNLVTLSNLFILSLGLLLGLAIYNNTCFADENNKKCLKIGIYNLKLLDFKKLMRVEQSMMLISQIRAHVRKGVIKFKREKNDKVKTGFYNENISEIPMEHCEKLAMDEVYWAITVEVRVLTKHYFVIEILMTEITVSDDSKKTDCSLIDQREDKVDEWSNEQLTLTMLEQFVQQGVYELLLKHILAS